MAVVASPLGGERLTAYAIFLCVFASMGGLIFGYDTGQISGIITMPEFGARFGWPNGAGGYYFPTAIEGLIVGLLSIGTMFGALTASPVADTFGRRVGISVWSFVFIAGTLVQILSFTAWYQIAIGRFICGMGIGGLSVTVPLYQAETAPKSIRGTLVASYQLFITIGIFIADCINYGTERNYRDSAASWRITIGVGFAWALILGFGALVLPESPRYLINKGRIDQARINVSKMRGAPLDDPSVETDIQEIAQKLEIEHRERSGWGECFTGHPKLAYRTFLGIILQALQQLTGANYFFYFGTTVFQASGVTSPYVVALILGGINVAGTLPALYLLDRFGRRGPLIIGSLWMSVMFFIFAAVGHNEIQGRPDNHPAGIALIVVAALFIIGFASTWGPSIWIAVSELYPIRIRSKGIALATTSNWFWNFLIGFFTTFIVRDIDFNFGYVFAGCNLFSAFFVYYFVYETKGLSLEEIDEMFADPSATPRNSDKWQPSHGYRAQGHRDAGIKHAEMAHKEINTDMMARDRADTQATLPATVA